MIELENAHEIGATFAEALVNLQTDLRSLRPNKSGYGYKYVDLAEILESVRPTLALYGFAVVQTVTGPEDGRTVGITTRLIYKTGEKIEDTFYLPPTDVGKTNAAQKLGASITYGRRYALAAILGIASDEDTDGRTEDDRKAKAAHVAKTMDGEVLTPTQRAWELIEVHKVDKRVQAHRQDFEESLSKGEAERVLGWFTKAGLA